MIKSHQEMAVFTNSENSNKNPLNVVISSTGTTGRRKQSTANQHAINH